MGVLNACKCISGALKYVDIIFNLCDFIRILTCTSKLKMDKIFE